MTITRVTSIGRLVHLHSPSFRLSDGFLRVHMQRARRATVSNLSRPRVCNSICYDCRESLVARASPLRRIAACFPFRKYFSRMFLSYVLRFQTPTLYVALYREPHKGYRRNGNGISQRAIFARVDLLPIS